MTRLQLFVSAVALGWPALAQQTVAPTPEQTGSPTGENVSGYNIVDSFETGYRFRTVGGSFDQYRSVVNYGDGIRLLSSNLSINSLDGHGRFFDEIILTTQGLGNDPYQNAILRIQKNRLYRYDMSWRLNDYFNPGLLTGGANDLHQLDTEYTTQDHDLTLFPQSNIKFFLGYTHANQNGPAISTIQLFNDQGNEFPLFENVRRVRNEYRIGNEVQFFGIRINWTRGWDDFKEDSQFSSGPNLGTIPGNPTTITSFGRNEPFHGTSPYWRVGIFADRKLFSVNGRFTYTSGHRDYLLDESAIGTARFAGATNRQVLAFGNAQRPVITGNLLFSFYPSSKLTITNQTSVYNVRIDGNSTFVQFDNATQTLNTFDFQFLGIRTITNETDLNYQAKRWLGLFGGYQYSDRQIRSVLDNVSFGIPFSLPTQQTNILNTGIFGIRLKPIKPLTILLDGEVGRANRPLAPISDRNYQDLEARVQYKVKSFSLSAYTRANYNTNSVSLSSYASHARTYAADASWTPREWFSLDAGYSKLHLNTAGGIDYFTAGQFITGEQSLYISNLHTATLGTRFAVTKRVDLFAGYSHVQDTGDGRSDPLGSAGGSTLPVFQAAQTFPIKFQSPLARLSVRITEKIRWNVGYQYYGYHEAFFSSENFRAHTGYTSVLWSF
jgi:hypothetical protein